MKSRSYWCFLLTLGAVAGVASLRGAQEQGPAKSIRILDVARVNASQPAESAVIELIPPARTEEIACDVLVVGGGTGGVAAALAAARNGHGVCLTEETTWLGGQMTAQGVSALDENQYIEKGGGTQSYLNFRKGIRSYYAQQYRLSTRASSQPNLNPGNCWVSALCFEAPVAVKVLNSMLEPYLENNVLRVFLRTKAVKAERSGDRIDSVLTYGFESHRWISFHAREFIDATELGELLPLVGAEYVTGAESQSQTREPHARPVKGDPKDSQSFTYTFVLAKNSDHKNLLAQPPDYPRHRDQQPYTLQIDYGRGKFLTYRMFQKAPNTPGSFWTYRRLIAADNFSTPYAPREASMINWPGNDYCGSGLLTSDPAQQAAALREAKLTSLGFAYWLQNEVPRDEGGKGYPEIELETSLLGSSDGLSQFPYIRESRRIRALEIIKEQDLSAVYQHGARARSFADSIGIGLYSIDIHSCSKQDFASKAKPFQIPLGALIPRHTENLLAAAKNIGTTHITNGAYRLHPVEWAIGEAAGTLAALALDRNLTPAALRANRALVEELQRRLLEQGVPIYWFDDLEGGPSEFRAVQFLAARGILEPYDVDLHFYPQQPVEKGEGALALARALGLAPLALTRNDMRSSRPSDSQSVVRQLVKRGYWSSAPEGTAPPVSAEHQLTWADLSSAVHSSGIGMPPGSAPSQPIPRSAFAIWLEQVYRKLK